MGKTRMTAFAVGAVVVMAGALAGCSSEVPGTSSGSASGDDITIGVSFDNMTAFREGEKAALDKAAKELGVKLKYQVAQLDAQTQSTQIQTLISQGARAIVAIPSDIEAIKADIDSAQADGVPIVTLDQAPSETSWVSYHVGGDPHADGLAAGKKFVELAAGKPYKLLELQGALNNDNGIRRSSGLHEGIKDAPNITIVSSIPTDWKPEPALTGIQNTLQKYPDLDGIFIPTDGQIPPAYSALKAANRFVPAGQEGHVDIVAIDGDSNGCKAVKDGYVDMDIATPIPAMTKNALEAAIAAAKGKPKNKAEFLPGTPYTPADVDKLASQVWGCAS
ncbi:sugar ABC transporter substrate-binding protein [Schumannella sp. 10F1B-5-1]|uniref:sugar ABC transporter substrate-binding protein n=1 Tax=Schumannella sp. 10F1B-5-1 TaxID=2590780 RepID=UPI0011320E2D|nr:sugar ABC transporter substrate-binding protein [Schumannella sp. 10F1B-5-1]TPW72944.1 sugar ABC transporter substrate-binding protein [Schumannella sp. 10F1B-5-1]